MIKPNMSQGEKVDGYMKQYGVSKEKAENYVKMTSMLQNYRKTQDRK